MTHARPSPGSPMDASRSRDAEGGAGTTSHLVGVGRCTKGLRHLLDPGQPAVIGRHADCTIVITRTPTAGDDLGQVSRRHAVVEHEADLGWGVKDCGSTNGTALLRGGLPPAVSLSPGVRHPLGSGDVIELAGSDEFQFVYHATPAAESVVVAAGEARTMRLLDATRPSLQLLHGGTARLVVELDEHGVVLGGQANAARGGYLPVPGAGAAAVGTVVLQGEHTSLLGESEGLSVNLTAVSPGQSIALRDKDLVTFRAAPDVSILFLDPRQTPTRKLSDLLAGAERITIGTASSSSCRIVDPSLSRTHAEIWRAGDGLFVRDLQSSNGTTVDGRRVFETVRLERGSRLSLGRLSFIADPGCWDATPAAPPSVDVRFVRVSVEIAGKLRLRGVSLGVGQGEMVGVLGPSASGKSTLLKVLAGRHRLAEGELYVNGRAMSQSPERWSWLTSLMGVGHDTYDVGFVQQIDLVQPELTVREILAYAARHMGQASAQAEARAQEAGELCNLGPLMDRVVQLRNEQLNVSGGQLKRICVAVEVLRRPQILVLDEPTTGQDPKNTDDLMRLFRSLAQNGVTLLLSTHDLRNLALFDKVVVVCLGHLVYAGPPDSFAAHFGAPTAEDVYASLPDREDRMAEAETLAKRFRANALYRRYCEAPE